MLMKTASGPQPRVLRPPSGRATSGLVPRSRVTKYVDPTCRRTAIALEIPSSQVFRYRERHGSGEVLPFFADPRVPLARDALLLSPRDRSAALTIRCCTASAT